MDKKKAKNQLKEKLSTGKWQQFAQLIQSVSNNLLLRRNVEYKILCAFALIIISALELCQAHVALTYPPARNYALDFLDNSRTKGPCGMPRGKHFYSKSS